MFKLKNLPLTISLIVLISLVVGWGISMVFAWIDPTVAPPSGNVAAPINVSSTNQWKDGKLGVGTAAQGIYWLADVGDSLYIQNKDATTRMAIGYDGNVGIGITSPGTLLDVQKSSSLNVASGAPLIRSMNTNASAGDGSSTYNFASLRVSAGNAAISGDLLAAYNSGGLQSGIYLRSINAYPLIFQTSSAERMRISSTGNVGIGTTGPGYKLTVSGGAIGGNYGLLPNYAAWNAYGVGDGGAAIYNDNGIYKALMIVGSDQAQGLSRWVRLWDNLSVAGLANCNTIDTDASGTLRCGTDAGAGAVGGSGVNTQVAFWTGTDTLGTDDQFIWESANNRLRLGPSIATQATLHVNGGIAVEGNLVLGGSTRVIGAIKSDSTIEAGSYIYSGGDIKSAGSTYVALNLNVSGRIQGLLNRSTCYWKVDIGAAQAACNDGDYMAGVDLVSSNEVRAYCCGSSASSILVGPGNPPDPCLAEGTKIRMADGALRNIEDIKVGEKVLAYDAGQKKLIEQMVLKTSIHPDYKNGYYVIETESGHELKATGNHPLYIGDNYRLTRDLKPLDTLYIFKDGNIAQTRIKSISFISETASVYNLEIEIDQNYFGNGILVHNVPKSP